MNVSAPLSGPLSKSINGQWTAIFGRPGRAPRTISSMLGWVAAVRATESPSQESPALIHRIWIGFSSSVDSACWASEGAVVTTDHLRVFSDGRLEVPGSRGPRLGLPARRD